MGSNRKSRALIGSHGSDRVHMTERATGSDVTPEGSLRVRACATGRWDFPPFFSGVLTGNDVTRKGGRVCACTLRSWGSRPFFRDIPVLLSPYIFKFFVFVFCFCFCFCFCFLFLYIFFVLFFRFPRK